MEVEYTSKEACRIADITYRQLHYWDKTNLVKPSIAAATGTGSRRVYSFVDLVCLRVTARLKAERISLQSIRKGITYLSKNFPNQDKPLSDFVFLTDGDSIFALTDNANVALDILKGGQLVLSIAIGHIIQDTKSRIVKLKREEESKGHVFEAVIELDKDVYLAYCPNLPGCITWGYSKAEAFHYIQDAIKLHLEDMIADGNPIPGIGVVNDIEEVNPVIRIKESKSVSEKLVHGLSGWIYLDEILKSQDVLPTMYPQQSYRMKHIRELGHTDPLINMKYV